MGVTMHVMQYEYGAVSGSQSRQRACEIETQISALRSADIVSKRLKQRLPKPLAATLDDEAAQPGAERRLAAARRETRQRACPRLLQRVGGAGVPATRHPARRPLPRGGRAAG